MRFPVWIPTPTLTPMTRRDLNLRRVVVKVGSSLLTTESGGLDVARIRGLSAQIARARGDGREIVLVSSGAIAAGMGRLGWRKRPTAMPDLQVAAAVGQMGLIEAYEEAFAESGLHAAQVLLTAEDMAHRTLYLNARAALRQMLARNVIPVVNENDVIATAEIRFGDNDRLAAQLANLLEADALVMMTDAPGLCRDAKGTDVVSEGKANDSSLREFVFPKPKTRSGQNKTGGPGSGGMESKLSAAQTAARSGAHSFIVDGRASDSLSQVLAGEEVGTLLLADSPRLSARKRWLAGGLHVRGALTLDAGAVRALLSGKRSLLPAGVSEVRGTFARGDAVSFAGSDGRILGYGLINYDSPDARKLTGAQSGDIEKVLGYSREDEMIHRDNMTIL